ncbi:hypothetical protein DFJ73DRAFT_822063 [Zopfochytrium polystomum]|nr:hypothetical protein DFJ73DRAFT_822063 [Zopfochytrium polystomum]
MLYPAPGEARKYAENISNAISLGSLYYQCLALPGEASYVPDAYCKTWTSDFALVICAALLTIFMLVFTLGLSEYDLRFWQPLLRIHALLVIAFEFAIDPNFYVFGNPMGVGWVRYFLIRIGSPILSAVFLATSLNVGTPPPPFFLRKLDEARFLKSLLCWTTADVE